MNGPAAHHVLTVSASIDAPAGRLYSIIADYHEGHPAILPRPPFVSLTVEEGGVGAGTLIRVEMKTLGALQTFRARVSEPEPGRTLVETNDTGYTTTFTVDPRPGGVSADVTISTTHEADGLWPSIERRLAARMLRPVYQRELRQLATVASRCR